MKYIVSFIKYETHTVEAESEEEAIDKAESLNDSDYDEVEVEVW